MMSPPTWIQRLTGKPQQRDEALAELRTLLVLRLRKSLQDRSGDDQGWLEDVVQETLVKTMNHLDQFQGRSKFTTWVTSIAVRTALTHLRRRQWQNVSLDQVVEHANLAVDQQPGPKLNSQRARLVETLYQVIDQQLTDKQRTVLLAELKGMPQEEIGRRMGSNRNAIYKLAHDARKRLRRKLEAVGVTSADLERFAG